MRALRSSVLVATLVSSCIPGIAASAADPNSVPDASGTVPVTATVAGGNMMVFQRLGTIATLSSGRQGPGGRFLSDIDGSLITVRDPRAKDPGGVAVALSSEHAVRGGPFLADSSGRLIPYRILVNGIEVRSDGAPLPIDGSSGSIETTAYRVSFDIGAALSPPADACFQDTVTLSIIP